MLYIRKLTRKWGMEHKRCRCVDFSLGNNPDQFFKHFSHFQSPAQSSQASVWGSRFIHSSLSCGLSSVQRLARHEKSSVVKLTLLAGDLLLARAYMALASLKNTEKTYYKRASLISNSCKSISIIAGRTAEVSTLACEHGKNLGLAYQLIDDVIDFTGTPTSPGKGSLFNIRHCIITAPILFAMEEFPELRAVVDQGFDDSANVDRVLEYHGRSRGIERTRELAKKHAKLASSAIDSFPETDDESVKESRSALVELTERVITGTM